MQSEFVLTESFTWHLVTPVGTASVICDLLLLQSEVLLLSPTNKLRAKKYNISIAVASSRMFTSEYVSHLKKIACFFTLTSSSSLSM